jgi:hypothetical protein
MNKLIKAAMNEAYQEAARAVCSNCAIFGEPKPEYAGSDEYVHTVEEVGGMVKYECWAAPIYDLIAKLNGDNDEPATP